MRDFTRTAARDCPSCGGDPEKLADVADHVSGASFVVSKCRGCELIFLSDPPVAQDLASFYDNFSGATMHRSPSAPVVKARSVAMRSEVRWLSRHIPTGSSVTDVGAGDGALATILQQAGFRTSAADIYSPDHWSIPGISYQQYDPSLPTRQMLRLDADVTAVTMRHVLEHVLEPRALLECLREQGVRYIFLTVPNVGSRLARRLGGAWYYWDPPRHITFFTPQTLGSTARRAGWDVLDHRLVGLDEIVTSVHRATHLHALRRSDTPSALVNILASLTRPTGVLASLSSAAIAPFGSATIKAVLRAQV